jgi:hypothetical protein
MSVSRVMHMLLPVTLFSCRSLVLADPWDSPGHLPVQFLTQLTHLSFLAEGLLVPRLAAQFCEALSKLPLLHTLALSRLQLSAQAAQLLGQTLMELPRLSQLALSGGAAPVGAAELYVLLNGEQCCLLVQTWYFSQLLRLHSGQCSHGAFTAVVCRQALCRACKP